jgi:hypothetical protein
MWHRRNAFTTLRRAGLAGIPRVGRDPRPWRGPVGMAPELRFTWKLNPKRTIR